MQSKILQNQEKLLEARNLKVVRLTAQSHSIGASETAIAPNTMPKRQSQPQPAISQSTITNLSSARTRGHSTDYLWADEQSNVLEPAGLLSRKFCCAAT